MFNSNTPDTIKIKPSVPSRLGTWLYLKMPNKVTAVIVNAPYDAYAVETGIMLIALDKQKIQMIILKMQKIVGPSFVKLSVVFKNPFEAIPVTIARNKYIYPEIKLILFISLSRIVRPLYISKAILSLLPQHHLVLNSSLVTLNGY